MNAGSNRGEGANEHHEIRHTDAITNLRLRCSPSAATSPMITGTAFEEEKADIRNHGILEPIKLYLGMILDGRNRYAAAKAVGDQLTAKDFKEWNGTVAEAEAWVISKTSTVASSPPPKSKKSFRR